MEVQRFLMNPETLTETIQKGVRVTLGATASLVDALRDPQASQEKFGNISDFEVLSQELEAKGTDAEREARAVVDSLVSQIGQVPNPFAPTPASEATVETYASPIGDPSVQTDLEALTQELSTLREEVEALKKSQQGDR
jgi:polyhydroxyalkanoate synthesis regulator phasin